MTDYITRQAQRVVDRITADAVAAATRAYGKVLPIQVQQGIESGIADLLPGLEAEQRQEEADWQAEQAKRLGNIGVGRTSSDG
jgi:hypothetical protein